MDRGLEKLFHLGIVLASGACAVYLMTKSSITARQGTIAQDNIEELATPERDEDLEDEEDSDLLSSYWAGSIPEGAYFFASPASFHSSSPYSTILHW